MGKKSVSKMETVVEPKKRKREPLDEVHKGKSKKKGKSHDKAESTHAAIKATNSLKKRKVKRMRKSICDLPPKLLGKKIFRRVPITSLSAVRSTCKLWNSLSRDWILGKAIERQQFQGFMMMDSKVCSVRFDLFKDQDKDKGDRGLVDLSIKQVEFLGQVEVSKLHYCKGLVLCVPKDNVSSLVVWNPYLGQTRWIKPRVKFNIVDRFALGYDKKSRSHKILRFVDGGCPRELSYEIYDFSSDSWRVLDVTPHWDIEYYQRGASLKGNSYFFAQEKDLGYEEDPVQDDYLICFDFTSETFGPRLALPFPFKTFETVALACVKEEQLAVLHQQLYTLLEVMQIWVTTKIGPNVVSWSRFLKLDMRPLSGFQFSYRCGSFFIDEEKKVAVVFEYDDGDDHKMTVRYNTAFIIGDDGYYKTMNLGEAQYGMCFPLVCSSSYLPSLVQIKGKARDV